MRALLSLALLLAAPLVAQRWEQRGYIDWRGTFFPQEGSNDSAHAVGDVLLRYEMASRLTPWLKFNGAVDGRTDTHRQTERNLRLDWQDRSRPRPAISLRRFSLTANRGKWTLEAGKQFIRWGKADILNPLDRFAPRDFLNVTDSDYLGVMAVRATWESGPHTIDTVWQPRFTPSRTPLFNQRWVPLEATGNPFGGDALAPGGVPVNFNIVIREGAPTLPKGPHYGIRWNYAGSRFETSAVYYQGHNHLPLIDARLQSFPDFTVEFFNYFAQMRMTGAAAAVPLRWFTVKSEAGYFTSSTPRADNYLQYVIQLERQQGEWTFVGGYAGEYVTIRRLELDFAPDRGLARSFLGRASVQLTPNDTLTFDAVIRETGDGALFRGEFARTLNDRWSIRLAGALIRGVSSDFLGQFRRNSHGIVTIRYSF